MGCISYVFHKCGSMSPMRAHWLVPLSLCILPNVQCCCFHLYGLSDAGNPFIVLLFLIKNALSNLYQFCNADVSTLFNDFKFGLAKL